MVELFFEEKKFCLKKIILLRLGKLMRASTIDKILELCEEYTPGEMPEYFFDR